MKGFIDVFSDEKIKGWIYNPETPGTPVSLDLLVDGGKVGSVTADKFRKDLHASGMGNGEHGFEYLPETGLGGRHVRLVEPATGFVLLDRLIRLPSKVIADAEEANDQPVKLVIAGFEHSGTTLVSDIIRNSLVYDSGFECGFLLVNKPKDFKHCIPFYEMLIKGWGITPEDRDHILEADSLKDMYARLRLRSAFINPELELFDKTPQYMKHLKDVMTRGQTPKTIVMLRNPVRLFTSCRTRRPDEPVDVFLDRYNSYVKGFMKAYNSPKLRPNILPVYLEDLCEDQDAVAKRIYEFIGLEFSPDKLRLNSKFLNVRGKQISKDVAMKNKTALTEREIEQLDQKTLRINLG
ncbi:MAG: sulfotransferase [Pseudodesulfovibrio sp.]